VPARVNKIRHDENTRLKIRVGNIINRLEKLVMGEIEMPPHAVTAALGLLRKRLPDMALVEHSGEITKTYVARMPSKSADIDEWRKKHAPQPTIQ
jgi:hypothetical protein